MNATDWKKEFDDFYYFNGKYSRRGHGYSQYVDFIEVLLAQQRQETLEEAAKTLEGIGNICAFHVENSNDVEAAVRKYGARAIRNLLTQGEDKL